MSDVRSLLLLGRSVLICALVVLPTAIVMFACGGHASSRPSAESSPAKAPADVASSPVREGDRIGPFVMDRVDRSGKIRIPSAGAKLTLIDFFGTFCGNSRVWFRALEGIHQRYGDRGLAIIAVGQDAGTGSEAEDFASFAKESGATFPVVWDRGAGMSHSVRPPQWQSLVIVDEHGVVKHVHVGTRQGAAEEIEQRVKTLLEVQQRP